MKYTKSISFPAEKVSLQPHEVLEGHWKKHLPSYAAEVLSIVEAWLQGETHFTLYSSGSSGTAQPFLFHKTQAIASAKISMSFLKWPLHLPFFLCLSTKHVGGFMQVVRALCYNHSLEVASPLSYALAHMTRGKRFALLSTVPLQLHRAIQKALLHHIEQSHVVIIGGAPINLLTEKALHALHTRIYHSYGMTETLSHIALRRLHAPTKSYFEALPSITLLPQSDGTLGVRSPVNNYCLLRTPDKVQMAGKNRFIWEGRTDHVINSGGIKLPLHPIDRLIETYFLEIEETQRPVTLFFSWGLSDEALGEKLVLFSEEVFSKELRQTLRLLLSKKLSKYHVPKEICVISPFVFTSSGKIDKIHTTQLKYTSNAF